ncbi:MAG TPA: hypothetical protein VF723_14470 [Pyrinomonadaceae bacterium]|jgi:hypothetical protein
MKHIKRLSVIAALILFVIPLSAQAQSRSHKETIEQLEDAFSTAFGLDTLKTLDAKGSNPGKLRVVVEHPGADLAVDPKGEYERKVFETFGQLGLWLKSRENEGGLPLRVSMPLVACKRGLCTYNFDGGILHNHLYLQKISYGYRKRRPYIKTIFLLAG